MQVLADHHAGFIIGRHHGVSLGMLSSVCCMRTAPGSTIRPQKGRWLAIAFTSRNVPSEVQTDQYPVPDNQFSAASMNTPASNRRRAESFLHIGRAGKGEPVYTGLCHPANGRIAASPLVALLLSGMTIFSARANHPACCAC